MRRSRRAASALCALPALALLVGCAAPAVPPASTPPTDAGATPTADPADPGGTPGTPAAASALRCLTQHSPWRLDLAAAATAWQHAADPDDAPSASEASGTALLHVTDDDPAWRFTADGVTLELLYADGRRERTVIQAGITARLALDGTGRTLVLTELVAERDETRTTATTADGDDAGAPWVPPLQLPWREDGSALDFSCTEHRLVVSDPRGVPAAWTLLPSI